MNRNYFFVITLLMIILLADSPAHGQLPVALTDKIHNGSGEMNILKDIGGEALMSMLDENGTLYFGVDLNENASGNESRDSVGIAIKQMELLITTTAGTYSFRDFYTSTTALILEQGASQAQEFHTMFGRIGSSSITPGQMDSSLAAYDDVVQINNIQVEGQVIDARLVVRFLDTDASSRGENETFFDYSNGFEDFAILNRSQAQQLEAARFGMDDAPQTVSFAETVSPLLADTSGAGTTAPGAPAPPALVLGVLGVLLVIRQRFS